MKYKGKELVKMTPVNWDGKSREMLVWDDFSKGLCSRPCKKIVIGYFPRDNYWMTDDGYSWHHCAEIPEEEKVETIEELSLKTEEFNKEVKKIQEEVEKLKEENERLKMGVELKLLKTRGMTYKELDEWLTQHKGVARIGRNILKKIVYDQVECNKEVSSSLEICGYDEYTWHKPTVEVFTRILRG